MRGPGIPQKAGSLELLCVCYSSGKAVQKQAANTVLPIVTSDELAPLILSVGYLSSLKQLLHNWATGIFFKLTFFFVKRDRKKLAREMASASSEIYNNPEMEDVCEYLPACLWYLWEGKTEGLVFIRTPQADASLKKTSLCSNFYCFPPSICA